MKNKSNEVASAVKTNNKGVSERIAQIRDSFATGQPGPRPKPSVQPSAEEPREKPEPSPQPWAEQPREKPEPSVQPWAEQPREKPKPSEQPRE